jgi:multiple sugar transport system ATP-binding protein
MRAEITTLQRELEVTTIYVTHDQVEAMTMGTRIAVLRKGVLQQQGTPEELYRRPANLFVASFIGSPAMNLFRGRLEATGGRLECVVGSQRLPVPAAAQGGLVPYAGRELAVGARPEYLRHAPGRNGDQPTLEGEVMLVESLGAEKLVHVGIAAEPVLTDEVLEVAGDADAAMVATLEREARDRHVPCVARFDGDVDVRAGHRTRIAPVPEQLQFFDLESGLALR